MTWWFWLALGLALTAIELVTPGGFFFLFFGVGAVVIGLLTLAGVSGPPWVQWMLFSAVPLAALVVARKPLAAMMRRPEAHEVDALTDQIATALGAIPPGEVGRAELRGTVWQARNLTDHPIGDRQRCRVLRVDGLELGLQPEGSR